MQWLLLGLFIYLAIGTYRLLSQKMLDEAPELNAAVWVLYVVTLIVSLPALEFCLWARDNYTFDYIEVDNVDEGYVPDGWWNRCKLFLI